MGTIVFGNGSRWKSSRASGSWYRISTPAFGSPSIRFGTRTTWRHSGPPPRRRGKSGRESRFLEGQESPPNRSYRVQGRLAGALAPAPGNPVGGILLAPTNHT